MMSKLKGTIHDLDKRLSQWAMPPALRAATIEAMAPPPTIPVEHRRIDQVSEAELEKAARLAFQNMKQLSAWVNHSGSLAYAAGATKARESEVAMG